VVTPNHLGYAYLANRLASWGYFVCSINANRGITAGGGVAGDFGLNLARGRLVLRHLQQLSRWNQGVDALPASLGLPANGLVGKLDFNNIGLMGHSRGGEGMRAAWIDMGEHVDPFEPMRAVFGQLLSRSRINMSEPIDIIALRNDDEYSRIVPNRQGQGLAAGFFIPGADREYFTLNLSKDESWRSISRDFALVFLNYNYPPTQPWFDECFAE